MDEGTDGQREKDSLKFTSFTSGRVRLLIEVTLIVKFRPEWNYGKVSGMFCFVFCFIFE